ncbi:MAG TPA: hypothetical protein VLL54_12565 [Pyrinomonadaceae bacterium]|nr:hypothetical protein [Pyrinomonadaceae bacterium]
MANESWYGKFYIGHLHVTERNRIRDGNFNPSEREMLARDEDPWEKLRKPLPPDLLPPQATQSDEPTDAEVLESMRPETRQLFESPTLTPQQKAGMWQGAKKRWWANKVRPSVRNPSEEYFRRQNIKRAVQSNQPIDPDDVAGDWEKMEFQKGMAEDLERKSKKGTTVADATRATLWEQSEILWYAGDLENANRVAKLAEGIGKTQPEKSEPVPPQSSAPHSSKRLSMHSLLSEVTKHRGWYLVAFLLGGLPIGIATIWPTLTDKKVPQWLAEHGWPSLSILVLAWLVVVAFIAIVIIVRSCLTAMRSQAKDS